MLSGTQILILFSALDLYVANVNVLITALVATHV